MADLNLDELSEQFEQASRNLNGFNTGLLNSTNSSGILTQANKKSAEAISKEAKAREAYADELKKSAKELGSSVKGMAVGLTQGQTGLQSMSTVIGATTKAVGGLLSGIPLIGGVLKGAADGVAEASKIMIDQLQVGWDAFRGLADTGIVSTFKDLKQIGDATGQRYEQVNATLGKYSNTLSMLGGTTLDGAKSFAKLAKSSEQIRGDFYKLGINSQEFAEFQLKYIDEQTRTGRIQGKTDAQLVAGTKQYIEELDTLAKLTGISRKEAQDKRNSALADTRFAATMMTVSDDVKNSFLNVSQYLDSKGGPDLAKGFRDAASGFYNSPDAKQFLMQTGKEGQEVIRQLKNKQITEAQAANKLSDAYAMNIQRSRDLAQATGDQTVLAKNLYQQQRMANAPRLTAEQIKAVEASRDANDAQTEQIAESIKSIDKSSMNLQQLATSGQMASKAVAAFGSSIEKLTDFINDKLGIRPEQTRPVSSRGMSSRQSAYMAASSASASGGLTSGLVPLSSTVGGPTGKGKFYTEMYNTLYAEAKKAGVPNPEVIAHLGASQSALETGNGKHLAGGNNYFGIKSHNRPGGNVVSTDDWVNGKMVNRKQSFRAYNNMNESAADYINFLQTNKRYAGLFKQSNVQDAINLQETTGYAAPGYGPKLQKIYEQNVGAVGAPSGGVTVAAAPTAAAPVATEKEKRKDNNSQMFAMVMSKIDDMTSLLQRSLAIQQKIANNSA